MAGEKTNCSETLVSNICQIAHTGGNRLSSGDVAGVMIKVSWSGNGIKWQDDPLWRVCLRLRYSETDRRYREGSNPVGDRETSAICMFRQSVFTEVDAVVEAH